MRRKSLIIAAFLIISTLTINAQSGSAAFEFVENKGQWDNRVLFKGDIPAGAFYLQKNGFTVDQHNADDLARIFDRYHGLHDVKKHPTKEGNPGPKTDARNAAPGPSIIHSHAYRVQFLGANENAQVIPDKILPTYNNYLIGNDPSKWAGNVKIFQAVLYKNIYPNIDIRYYSENGRLKYDLVVNPGGDVNNIVMKYEGADKLSIRNNELLIKTSLGNVKELYPYAYQFDKTTGKKEVICNFELADKDKVRFKVSNYSKTSTLVIDPTLIFCSFTGSTASQWGFTATPGPDGSLYSGGIVFGSGFPTSPGAYQTPFQGGTSYVGFDEGLDIGIFKFNPTGVQRTYATYIGGKNGNEYPLSLICDPQGQLIVTGRTSSDDYPGKRIGTGGSTDILVTKLNAAGSNYVGSLRIGGSGADGVNIRDQYGVGVADGPVSTVRFYGDDSRSEVDLDGAGSIYIAAQTQSTNFPTTTGVFQRLPGGNNKQDGVVMKINSSCTDTIWVSYLGGSDDDGAFVLAINPLNNDIYVAGATASSDFPGNKTGAHQPTYGGGITDGFIAQISNDGTNIIKSTYEGTIAFDAIYGIEFDRNGFPYIMGVSEGLWPVLNVAFSNPGSKQFVSKLKPDLSGFVYSTVFGSGSAMPNISPVAFLVDRCENVYISGWGGGSTPGDKTYRMAGTAGMPFTADAIKSVTDNMDFYFIVIKKDAQLPLLYGTFFGQDGGFGEHVDGGTSRYDSRGVIYQAICANCYGSKYYPITNPFPATAGVWGPFNATGVDGCNLAAVKMSFNFVGVAEIPKAFIDGIYDTSGCVPLTVVFRDTILVAKSYEWNFGDGSPDVATTNFEVTHVYNSVGNYRVRLIGIDSSTCNIRDTAYTTIRVRDDRANLAFTKRKNGVDCYDLTYQFTNTSTAPPGKPFKANSFNWDFGDGTKQIPAVSPTNHKYSAPGTYIVRLILVDTNYCNAPDSIPDTLRVSPNVTARFETPPDGCVPHTAIFDNTSLAGQNFTWYFGDGSTSTAVNPTHEYQNVGDYIVKLIATDTNTCNKIDSITHTISVHPIPTAEFNTSPIPAKENTPTTFFNLSTGGARYKWVFGDGDSTIKTTMDTVMHQYNATGTYHACLTTYNQFNCPATICHDVNALIIPLLDVPNAFTPGRFGQNSIITVKGFGIGKMMWKIYNRWGQVVFQATDRKVGWDGSFKGQPQPMDVYAYTLDVEFTDGTKTRKSGDITLIR